MRFQQAWCGRSWRKWCQTKLKATSELSTCFNLLTIRVVVQPMCVHTVPPTSFGWERLTSEPQPGFVVPQQIIFASWARKNKKLCKDSGECMLVFIFPLVFVGHMFFSFCSLTLVQELVSGFNDRLYAVGEKRGRTSDFISPFYTFLGKLQGGLLVWPRLSYSTSMKFVEHSQTVSMLRTQKRRSFLVCLYSNFCYVKAGTKGHGSFQHVLWMSSEDR